MKNKYKILVVDDELEIVSVIQRYLKMEGYDVDVCQNPNEALTQLETGNYKILITDLVMPELTGPELIREAKKSNAFLQVIAITGYATVENLMLAFKYGANNCFFKPFKTLDVVKEEIDRSIEKLERIAEVLRERRTLR